MIEIIDVVPGRYFDSVRLLQVGRALGDLDGVEASLVAMATELNLELLAGMGFDTTAVAQAGSDDLLIAIRAVGPREAEQARTEADRRLKARAEPAAGEPFSLPAPRTTERTARNLGANLALVSVPGQHAFVEAMAALEAGLHVMVFSDNVSIEHELALKSAGSKRDLLVMGPDCGTAIVNGLGLGFANAVASGPVSIVGASGTGIQQLCCLLDASGVGVRHALGTGGRDLSSDIGAQSTLQALRALDADPDVGVIVLVSKPPGDDVRQRVEEAIAACRTPLVPALLGSRGVTLEDAARRTVELLGEHWTEPPVWMPDTMQRRPGALRGLFSGGTLRAEAHAIAASSLGPVGADPAVSGHWLCDFGADRYTRGRAHPMIDPTLRLDALEIVLADRETGVVLVDVVLGYGAHPDPASSLVPLIEAATSAGIGCVVSLCASSADPQGREGQARRLRDAGAEVYVSNAAAARRAVELSEVVADG